MVIGKRVRQFARKYHKPISANDTERVKILRAMTNDFWYENVLLDFIAAYQLKNKCSPTKSSITQAGVVPPDRIDELTKKLVDGGWITTWNNRYQHYEAKVAY